MTSRGDEPNRHWHKASATCVRALSANTPHEAMEPKWEIPSAYPRPALASSRLGIVRYGSVNAFISLEQGGGTNAKFD